jgi:hypothetical protein
LSARSINIISIDFKILFLYWEKFLNIGLAHKKKEDRMNFKVILILCSLVSVALNFASAQNELSDTVCNQAIILDYAEKYSKDKNHAYYDGESIKGADVATFKVIGFGYAKDKEHVYLGNTIIKGADPATFSVVGNVFHKSRNAEVEFIECYAKDKHKAYYKGAAISGADTNTFKVLTNGYAKDKNNVYSSGKTLKEADPKTFK